jgi:hypothetical protein
MGFNYLNEIKWVLIIRYSVLNLVLMNFQQ